MTAGLFFALGVMIAVFYLPYTNAALRWRRSIRKTLPVSLFALAAVVGGAAWELVLALIFSAIGDLALSRKGESAFLAGMLAFASAHIAYILAMYSVGADLIGLPFQIIAAFITLAVSTEFWLIPYTAALKWPVRIYVSVIALMGVVAMALPEGYEWAKYGALLFIVSDFILSVETFILHDTHRLKNIADKLVWITYIGAQIGLFLGLAPS